MSQYSDWVYVLSILVYIEDVILVYIEDVNRLLIRESVCFYPLFYLSHIWWRDKVEWYGDNPGKMSCPFIFPPDPSTKQSLV